MPSAMYSPECKRSCVERPWPPQRVAQFRRWRMGQVVVELRWMWHICVALCLFQILLPLCFLLWKVWYDMKLLTIVWRLDREPSDLDWLLVVLRCPFSHLYLAERFNYWACDCNLERYLRHHARGVFAGGPNFELFALIPLHRPSHNIQTPGWWQELKPSRSFPFRSVRTFHITTIRF